MCVCVCVCGCVPPGVTPAPNLTLFQEEFDQDVDALLEEGLPVAKKRRLAEDKFAGDSDHGSDDEGGVQPMMTKIKTVLKSEWSLGSPGISAVVGVPPPPQLLVP